MTDHILVLSDSLTISDSNADGIEKALSDTVTLSDSESILKAKVLSDSLSLSDSITSRDVSKRLTDTATLTDAPTKVMSRTFNDTVTLADYISKSYIIFGDHDEMPDLGQAAYALFYRLSDDSMYIETDIYDFGVGGIKTLEGLLIAGSFDTRAVIEVMVKWRNNKREEFNDTPWKRVSPEGYVAPLVSGVEFIICLRVSPCKDVSIDSMTANWKLIDKRFVRGMYNVAGTET